MAVIDPTMVKSLVETLLLARNQTVVPTMLFPHEAVPEGLTRWARLVAIDLQDEEAERSAASQDRPAHAQVVVTVNCGAAAETSQTSSHSLSYVLAEIARLLRHATLRDDTTGHQVDLFAARTVIDVDPDPLRRVASGAVIAEGMVCRTSGTSLMTPT